MLWGKNREGKVIRRHELQIDMSGRCIHEFLVEVQWSIIFFCTIDLKNYFLSCYVVQLYMPLYQNSGFKPRLAPSVPWRSPWNNKTDSSLNKQRLPFHQAQAGCGCHTSLGSLMVIFFSCSMGQGWHCHLSLTALIRIHVCASSHFFPSGCCNLNLSSELLFFLCLACEPASL